jgi:protease I
MRRREIKELKMDSLQGQRIAVLATDGFEQIELTSPADALKKAGASVKIISPKIGEIQGMHHDKPGDKIAVNLPLEQAEAEDFDALLLPGGVANPDSLRVEPKAIAFVKSFLTASKPIAAICHGPWTLIDAGGAKGKRMTSWPSLRQDLINAGADWRDEEVVQDGLLVTSRKPDDLPKFNAAMIELFAQTRSGRTR